MCVRVLATDTLKCGRQTQLPVDNVCWMSQNGFTTQTTHIKGESQMLFGNKQHHLQSWNLSATKRLRNSSSEEMQHS